MPAATADSDALLAAARSRPAPVYLLIGEPFATETAARALIDILVPAERRSFGLETYDGRRTAIGPILDSLRTPSLLGGMKAVWVREPALLLAAERRGEVVDALFAAWADGRHGEAAAKLFTLAAMAGWSQDELLAAKWDKLTKTAQAGFFGRALAPGEAVALDAIRAAGIERRLGVAAFRDDSSRLDQFLAAGPPPNTVLIFTASAVDRRKRVVKSIAAAGAVADMEVAHERSGALGPASIDALVDRVAGRAGKRIAPAVRQLIHRRAGNEAGALAAELEKLCLYVGEAPVIDEADVRASMRDLAESWIFDFTATLAQRQTATALAQLRALLEQGEPPLKLLGLIAREVRLLMLARDCLAGSLAGSWTPRAQYAVFRDRLLPALTDAEREGFGTLHPYVLYQCLQNASRIPGAVLERGLLALQSMDIALKSTSTPAAVRLESFVLDFCRPA